ncbi:MAG TPA: hypothetical protein VEU97_01095 [Ktedonobacteraceae bacterium]|nr:hypothetical protein [Ktedonobacteraceae bacterium]
MRRKKANPQWHRSYDSNDENDHEEQHQGKLNTKNSLTPYH